ncbi:STAS domain-containing protein [Streptomyces sp. HMX112]|uniref:STAS domain-containing protein n=1 Tax=Streptomyces sp. HMX112 TaxID=3390850 RepID=UPI003A80DD07
MENQTDGGAEHVPHVTRPRLTVVPAAEEGVPVLELRGDLDLTTVPLLVDAVSTATRRHGRQRVVLDCAGLLFCDSSGLNCFLQMHHGTGPAEGVVLANPAAGVNRLLDITGADQALTVTPTVGAALALLRS